LSNHWIALFASARCSISYCLWSVWRTDALDVLRFSLNIAMYGGPAAFAGRLHDAAASWNASGGLDFLNEW